MLQNNSSRPLVSILINNYNYGRFLPMAISSALDQTYQNKEIIVVDDGSSDNSCSVIQSFGSRIKAVYQPNRGQGSAYNTGFRESRGELLHFLDADDVLEPRAIEEAVEVWEPGVAKVHFYLRVIEGAEGKKTRCLLPANNLAQGDLKSEISRSGFYSSPPASGNVYWRDALERVLPMPELDWATSADTYTIFLSPLFGEVRACPKILGSYRVHGANQDAQTKVTPRLLRYRLEKDIHRDQLLLNVCASVGLPYERGTVEKDLAHMKLRLSSKVLAPAGHPYPNDRRLSLAAKIGRLCWQRTDWSLRKKLLVTGWIAFTAVAPQAIASRGIDLAFAPTKRLETLQVWISSESRVSVHA